MTNYPQELAQDAVCQSHTGHMTGLWFLPARPLRLNTNEWWYRKLLGIFNVLSVWLIKIRLQRYQVRSQNCEKSAVSFVISGGPHGTSRLPLVGFSLNFIFEYFSKLCQENSGFIKIWHKWRLLHMKTNKRFWSSLAQFFLWLEIFRTNFVDKIKTHILFPIIFFFSKIVPFMG